MKTGELVIDEKFTLYDCLTVLEIMSPKMDPGLKSKDIVTFGEKIKLDTFYPLQESNKEVIHILMKTLVLEATWLEGQHSIKTVFTLTLFFKLVLDKIKTDKKI